MEGILVQQMKSISDEVRKWPEWMRVAAGIDGARPPTASAEHRIDETSPVQERVHTIASPR